MPATLQTKKNHHMIKYISFWSLSDNKLISYQLDSDGSEGTDKKTAEAINISLKKIDPLNEEPKTKLHGLSTDAGGGGTVLGCANELVGVTRIIPIDDFICLTCCLHAHSLTFKSPVEKFFLLGGIKKRTLLYMLYKTYALQEEFEVNEYEQLWKKVAEKNYIGKLMQPVLTRWEYVGECLIKFFQHKEDYIVFAKSIRNTFNSFSQ